MIIDNQEKLSTFFLKTKIIEQHSQNIQNIIKETQQN